MVAAVWVLDKTWVVISRVVVTGVAVVIGRDMVVRKWGSELKRGGWRRFWCVVHWPGSECHHFRGAGSSFGAGDKAVVVVDDVVGIIDGGCSGIVSGGVAALEGKGGLVMRAMVARGSPQACEAVSQVLGSLVDIPTSFSRHGGSSLGAICITASAEEVSIV